MNQRCADRNQGIVVPIHATCDICNQQDIHLIDLVYRAAILRSLDTRTAERSYQP